MADTALLVPNALHTNL